MSNRARTTTRDMVVCMVVLVGSLLLVLGAMGGFSFSPGGPSSDDTETVSADVEGGFAKAGPTLGFDAVVPTGLPDTWHANVYLLKSEDSWGTGVVPLARGGWLTGNGEFIALIESPADAQSVLTQEVAPGLASAGSVEQAGRTWDIYPGVRNEVVWVNETLGRTLVITGSAVEADFIILAGALER